MKNVRKTEMLRSTGKTGGNFCFFLSVGQKRNGFDLLGAFLNRPFDHEPAANDGITRFGRSAG